MTSKISFYKLLKHDLKKGSGVMAIIALGLFLLFTLGGIISLDQMLSYIKYGSQDMQEIIKTFTSYVCYNWSVQFVTIFSAVFVAITRYSYLFSPSKLDFYHSLPVKRQRLFGIQYVSGMILYVIPLVANMLILLLTGAVRGVVTGNLVGKAAIVCFINILFFLLIYTTVILAILMTGKVITAIMGATVFLLYLPAVVILGALLVTTFFDTFYLMRRNVIPWIEYTSPLALYLNTIQAAGEGKMFIFELFAAMILLAVLGILCVLLYRRRPSEAAGAALSFKHSEGIIKFLLLVPIGVGTGVIGYFITWTNKDFWLTAGVVFGVLVVSGIIEFIYTMDFSKVLSRKRLTLASLLVSLAVIGFFRFDLMNYDEWLPDKESLESAAIVIENGMMYEQFENINNGNSGGYSRSRDYVLEHMKYTDIDRILAIAGSKIDINSEIQGQSISIQYNLKNNKIKTRSYYVESEVLEGELAELYKSQAYKEGIFPILNTTADELSNISLVEMSDTIQLNLSRKQMIALTDTYKEELAAMSYENIQESSLTKIYFEAANENGISGSYSLNKHFTETLKLLKEYGYEVSLSIKPEQIQSIKVMRYSDEEGGVEKIFTDKDDIASIAEAVIYTDRYGYYYEEYEDEYDVTIEYKDKNDDNQLANIVFQKGKVPDAVKNAYK